MSETLEPRRKDVALYDEWAAGPMDLKYQYWLERRIIDLESKLDPFYWTQAESDAWHRTIPDVRKAFHKLREVER